MKKRLFMVDYREDGIYKHQCIEVMQEQETTDAEIVQACHIAIGLSCTLDGVIEVLADMTAKELNEIALSPVSIMIPRRVLYINMEEVERVNAAMKNVKV